MIVEFIKGELFDIDNTYPTYDMIKEEYIRPDIWIDWIGNTFTVFQVNTEPNEPTVLECKDKMINEI